jgi:hypothetical protein
MKRMITENNEVPPFFTLIIRLITREVEFGDVLRW